MALKTFITVSALALFAVSTAQANPESKPGLGPDSVAGNTVTLADVGTTSAGLLQPEARPGLGPDNRFDNRAAFVFPENFTAEVALRPDSRPGLGPRTRMPARASDASRADVVDASPLRPESRPGSGPDYSGPRMASDTARHGGGERVALQPESRPGLAPATRIERSGISGGNRELTGDGVSSAIRIPGQESASRDIREGRRPASRTASLDTTGYDVARIA